MQTETVQLKAGPVVLRKPSAGIRNEAIMDAKWHPNDDHLDLALAFVMLPKCIVSHPWFQRPVKEAVGDLDTEEYDELIKTMMKLNKFTGDAPKKSETPSDVSPSKASTP